MFFILESIPNSEYGHGGVESAFLKKEPGFGKGMGVAAAVFGISYLVRMFPSSPSGQARDVIPNLIGRLPRRRLPLLLVGRFCFPNCFSSLPLILTTTANECSNPAYAQ